MTDRNFQLSDGATPLDPDEANGLKPPLRTREELNIFEQANIAQGTLWARKSRTLKNDLLCINSLKLLHLKMFGDTWKWAGMFRISGKNIGVEAHLIQPALLSLCGDTKYWIENEVFELDVVAIRLHHRLVSIHPFSNGNGRHARLVADLLMHYAKREPFHWGSFRIDLEGETRKLYLAALRDADKNNYESLIKFAKCK